MRTMIISAAIIAAISASAFGLEVDVDEISSTKRIQFINYAGKPGRSDSEYQVKAIGRGLAEGTRRTGESGRFSLYGKYSIIRAVSKEEPEKFSADIISIDKKARIGHIDNVRRIIAGYLESRYDYSRKNARTLAVFATFYNAVYRGRLDYLGSKYKSVVMKHLDAKNAGLSTKYYEWPGMTRIVIPLTEQPQTGKLDSIDPFVLSDERVRKAVREDEKTLEDRRDLIGIKEKTLDRERKASREEKEKLAEEKKELEKEKKRLDRDREDQERKKRETERARKELEKEKEKVRELKEPEEKKKEEAKLAREEEKLKREEEKTAREDKRIRDEERRLKEKKEEQSKKSERITEKEKETAKKEKALKEEKKELAKDEEKKEIKKGSEKARTSLEKKAEELEKKEKELAKREDEIRDKEPDKSIYAQKLYYMKIREYLEDGHYNNEMYMINAATRRVEFKSPVENICGSRYDVYSGGVAVITHLGGHQTAHRLTLLDTKTLAVVKNGDDDIFWRSFVEIREGSIYCICIEKGEYYLGRYDASLRRTARSAVAVNKDTFISFYDEFIYINRYDKKILCLKKEDLSLIDIIEPTVPAKRR